MDLYRLKCTELVELHALDIFCKQGLTLIESGEQMSENSWKRKYVEKYILDVNMFAGCGMTKFSRKWKNDCG